MFQRAALLLLLCASLTHGGNWPGPGGPSSSGIAHERHGPFVWSANHNVAWHAALPSAGSSSPIVWERWVFVTMASATEAKRGLVCFDRTTGKLAWQSFIDTSAPVPAADLEAVCSATPVTDGHRIYCNFGSAGLLAFDFNGEILWKCDLGPEADTPAAAASPVLHDDMVIQHTGSGDQEKLVAVSARTGEVIYQRDISDPAERADASRGSTATPIIVPVGDEPQLIVPLPGRLAAFNPYTGLEYWRCNGLGPNAAASVMIGPSPLGQPLLAVALSSDGGPMIACRLPDPSAKGDIAATHMTWHQSTGSRYRTSGIIFREHLYVCDEAGVLRCIDLASGNVVYEQPLGQAVRTAVLMVGGRLYVTDVTGTVHVIKPGPVFELVSVNRLTEPQRTTATPAFSDGQMFLRTATHLWCFGTRIE
jgi:outer membrane protein assembly factor BamB